jgi:chemotaxis family two-component system response regulator Rcp1
MASRSTLQPIEILSVEDNAGDIRLIEEALRDGEVTNNLTVAGDCDTALQMLRRTGRYADAADPDLILLDLGLPGKSGLEVLREIKTDPRLGRIPVVVLATSERETDILQSYNLQTNCFVNKPLQASDFLELIKTIEGFRLTAVELPPLGSAGTEPNTDLRAELF